MNVQKRYILKCILFLALISAFVLSSTAQSFDDIKNKIKMHQLDNGMKFIVLERHEAPVVSFHVYADVGSANESYGITGISHLLEHMAFKGTKTVGTKDFKEEIKILEKMDALYNQLKKEKSKINPDEEKIKNMEKEFESLRKKAKNYVINNEYFDMMMSEGDQGVNAYTSTDATQYINSLPSNKLEFWMAMTSDRFLNPVFREFYKEKNVVMEERRLGVETRPMGRLMEDFLAAAFKAHPYHHSVVGHMSDLERITRKDVKNYFKKYYGQNNLIVGIVGDVKPDEVFKLAELYFNRIPSGPAPERVRTIEPGQWGERRIEVEAKSQPIILIGYHCPSSIHKDSLPIEALANIMGQGRSSRLYRILVKEKKVAVNVSSLCGYPGDKYPNLIAFFAVPTRGHTSEECLELINKEIEKIKNESVSVEELKKFKRTSVKSIIDQMKSNSRMAALLTYAEVVLGGPEKIFNQIKEINAITADDIKQVATKYLVKKHRTIGEIVPEKKGK